MAWGNWCYCGRGGRGSRRPDLSVLPAGAIVLAVVALAAVADGVAHERPAINAGAAAAAFGGGGGGSSSPAPARPAPVRMPQRMMMSQSPAPPRMNHAPAPQRMMHRMKHVMTAPARTSKPMPKHRPTQAYPTYEKEDYDDHKYEWYKKPQKHGYGQDSSYGHKYSQKSYTPSYGNDDYEEEDDYYPEPSYGHAGPSYGHSEPSYGHSEPSYGHSEPSYGNAYRQYKRSYDDDDYEEGGYGAYEESYDHEPSYGHEEYGDEDDGREYEERPSYRHKRSVGYGSPYGSQSYTHKQSYSPKQSVGSGSPYEHSPKPSVGYGSPYGYEGRPSYRHRRSIDGLDTFVNTVADGVSSTIQAHADGKKAKVDFVKGLFSRRSVDAVADGVEEVFDALGDGAGVNSTVEDEGGVREGQQFFVLGGLLAEVGGWTASAIEGCFATAACNWGAGAVVSKGVNDVIQRVKNSRAPCLDGFHKTGWSCCSQLKPTEFCKEGEGDCDSDDECEGRLVCGKGNCTWGKGRDCCMRRRPR